MRRAIVTVAAAATLIGAAPAALGQTTTPDPATTAPTAPVAPVAPPTHPAAATGWGAFAAPAGALRPAPDPGVPPSGTVASARIAGRATGVARDASGAVWVRLAFPGAVAGWAPGDAIRAVPPPAALSPGAVRTLTGATASLGPRAALVVRDPWGRTVFAAGTPRPLMLASVTKLATVSAALSADPSLPVGPVAAILRPSDNAKAQALSNVLGSGSRTLGARRAADHAAALGAAWQVVDGSGLSRGNRAPAGEVADLLLGIRDEPAFRTLFRGLPVAGRTGTLEWRMRGTSAAGRVRAKTGTYDVWRASSLAGYFWPAGAGLGPERAFVVVSLENGVPPYRARPVQDAVAAALTARGALTPAATGG
ncbi:MAG TPA: D-alanyl-D-alanine carboxypeptidase [Miltoncostaeaceae bacterium]|nr:D-alanyl-D-alanine carboxypeptidase [Miltoncostaeaceae bacterium]